MDGALDRADHLRDDAAALMALWPQAGVIVLNAEGKAAATADGQMLPLAATQFGADPGDAVFLGLRDGRGWFLLEADAASTHAAQHIDLRHAAVSWPAWQATLFAQARALQHWHRRYRFCSDCGGRLHYLRSGWLGQCGQCGSEHYPRTDQAIIAAITDGERLLLGRQAGWAARRWSVLAGFVEPGETLEQAMAREVMEEAGVRVHTHSARYVASQPWPFPGALMLGFIAHAEAETPQAGDELEAARWFSAEQVRAGLAADWANAQADGDGIVLSSPISIARHIIQVWLDEHDAARANQ